MNTQTTISTDPEPIPARWLCIPTTPETWIPLSVSPEDFDLILATIHLWKPRIVAAAMLEPTVEKTPQEMRANLTE